MGKKAKSKRLKKEMLLSGADSASVKTEQFKLDKRVKWPIFIIALSVLFCIGIGLRLQHFDIVRRSPDEGIYTYQGKIIAENGVDGTRRLINEYTKNKSLWIYPPPIRIGYNYLLANVMKMSGVYNETAGSRISTFASIGTLLLLVLMGFRFFNTAITFIALLAMLASPMDLAMARRCWQDSLLAFTGTLLIYLCAEQSAGRRRNIIYLPILVIGTYCILIKESGIIIFGLCMLWLFLDALFIKKAIVRAFLAVIVGIAGVTASLLILTKITGGMSVVLEILKNVKDTMPTNTYAIEYQTGPWYGLIEGFWILTPFFTAACFLGLAGVVLNFRSTGSLLQKTIKSWDVARGITLFVAAFIIIAIIAPYSQNMRYVSVTLVPFYLLSGLGLWLGIRFVKERLGNFYFLIVTLFTVVIIIAVFRDYAVFNKIFIKQGIVDISIRLLRQSA